MSTTNLGLDTVPTNTTNPSVPVNDALEAVDSILAGTVSKEFTTDANLTLTAAEYLTCVLLLTDTVVTLTAARDVIFPAHFPVMYVKNSTAQTLTLKKSGQAGVAVAAGGDGIFVSGTTDVVRASGGSGAVTSVNGQTGAVTGVTAGKHAIWIPAGAMSPSATGGCAALATIASAANQPDIQTLDFDATTQEYAQFSLRMMKSWNEGTITFAPVWSHGATVTNFGVVWDLQGVAVSDDDPIAAAFGTAQTSTDTGGTTNDVYIGPESSAITIAGTPASEDVVFFRLSRVTGNGSDTMAVDARLHGVTVYFTTNADTDA